MGAAFEVITGRATNPGAAFTALTPGTGDAFAVRSAPFGSRIVLEDMWALGATAGIARIRSPRMHDFVQGIRMGYTAANPVPLFADEVEQLLYPQDVLTVEATGGAAETDMVTLLVHYDDLPGVTGQFRAWAELAPMIEQYMTIECQLTSGAVVGDYGGAQAINANFDTLKANTPYAVLGYVTSVSCCTVGLRSPDFGNLRVGGPGTNARIETRDWFIRLSNITGTGLIPVFNSANKGTTIVDVVHNAAGTAITVQFVLAQLRQS